MTPPNTAAGSPAGVSLSPATAESEVTALPARYNAATDLLGRNLAAGRGDKIAYIDDTGTLTFSELDARSRRFAAALHDAGFRREERLLLCALDTIDFPTVFLGCLLAGVVPVAVNTLLTVEDYAYMLQHSGARAVVVSEALLPIMKTAIASSGLSPLVIQAGPYKDAAPSCSVEAVISRTRSTRRWSARGRTIWRSGSIRPAPPAGPRAPCIPTATCSTPPTCMRAACSACAKTTWCFRRRSCSLPTGLAMR